MTDATGQRALALGDHVLLNRLIDRYPYVYHMAQVGTWPSIQQHGLLSTSAALDLVGIQGTRRSVVESAHRPEMLSLLPGMPDDIVLRDQKPMPPGRLRHALPKHVTPEEWYRLINGKVFFWVSKERLGRLLRSYGELEHDVLTIDTASLLSSQGSNVWLCHMNSGNTWPIPHRRDIDIFKRLPDYPVNTRGNPTKEVVELVVDYAVPDIANHVLEVNRIKGDVALSAVWRRPS